MKNINKKIMIIAIILFLISVFSMVYYSFNCPCGHGIYSDDYSKICDFKTSFFKFLAVMPVIVFFITLIINLLVKNTHKLKNIILWFAGTFIWRYILGLVAAMVTPIGKPLIYIYPKKKTNVTVKLGNEDILTCTYPKYHNKWDVIAEPNGNLIDKKLNKSFYGLYWEAKNPNKIRIKEGFCVKGTDTISFLEEKLSILGLNEREANEFIMYWLPRLEKNNYNLIRFKTNEEINEIMPLEIDPKPDTVIRIMMECIPLMKYKEIREQKLTKVTRTGYTVIEWGGTISNKKLFKVE